MLTAFEAYGFLMLGVCLGFLACALFCVQDWR